MKFTFGCDSEFFLFNSKKGRYECAAEADVPGTKAKPHKLTHGTVQIDGTAVEIGTRPATSGYEFGYYLSQTLREVRELIPKHFKFMFRPSVTYEKKYWESIPETYKKLGCDPYFNALNSNFEPSPVPKLPQFKSYGGGHLHLGWTKDQELTQSHFWDARIISRQCVEVLSKTRFIWENGVQSSRSTFYNIHAYRPKSYGVEYRGLSNIWLNYPRLWPWLFDTAKAIYDRTLDGKYVNFPYTYEAYSYNQQAKIYNFPLFPKGFVSKKF